MRFLLRDGVGFVKNALSKIDVAILIISVALYVWLFLLTYTPISVSQADAGNSFRVGSFNALVDSEGVVDGVKFFQEHRSDIVFLQEADSEGVQYFSETLNYPYVEISNCKCSAQNSDVAILSKYPLTNTSSVFESPLGVILKSEIADKDLILIAVHLPAPVNSEYFSQRNQMLNLLEVIVDDLNTAEKDYVIAGDFNTSVYSRKFSKTFAQAKAVSNRFWPHCTWYGYGEVLCTAIDHIVVNKNITATHIEYGRLTNSDHLPIYAELDL